MSESGKTLMKSKEKWSFLTQSLSLTLDISKILIGILAVLAMFLGMTLLDKVFSIEKTSHGTWPGNINRGKNPYVAVSSPEGRQELFTVDFWKGQSVDETPLHMEILKRFYQPLNELVTLSPSDKRWWYDLLCVVMTLLVWGWAGGAICRITAVQIARNEKVGMGEALRYASKRWFAYFFAPSFPLLILAAITVLVVIVSVPVIWLTGMLLPALLWFLGIIMGIVMIFFLLSLIGWPLMVAGISTEGEDGMGILARVTGLMTKRIWSYLKYALFSIAYGVIILFVVVLLASAGVRMGRWVVGLTPWTTSDKLDDPVGSSFVRAPRAYEWRDLLVGNNHPSVLVYNAINQYSKLDPANFETLKKKLKDSEGGPATLTSLLPGTTYPDLSKDLFENALPPESVKFLSDFVGSRTLAEFQRSDTKYDLVRAKMTNTSGASSYMIAFWLHLFMLVIIAIGYCLFWTSSTLIYFLLRHEEERAPIDEVYMDNSDDFLPWPQPVPAPMPMMLQTAPPAPAGSNPTPPPPPVAK